MPKGFDYSAFEVELPPGGEGAYVVGRYSDEGTKKSHGGLVDETSRSITNKIIKSALSKGGTVLPGFDSKTPKVKAGKVKKEKEFTNKEKRARADQREEQFQELIKANNVETKQTIPKMTKLQQAKSVALPASEIVKTRKLSVVFDSGAAKMKLDVVGILEQETSIILVFANEDEVRFTPAPGQYLNITIDNNKTHRVLYPGFIHTWVDHEKQLMILVKDTDANE